MCRREIDQGPELLRPLPRIHESGTGVISIFPQYPPPPGCAISYVTTVTPLAPTGGQKDNNNTLGRNRKHNAVPAFFIYTAKKIKKKEQPRATRRFREAIDGLFSLRHERSVPIRQLDTSSYSIGHVQLLNRTRPVTQSDTSSCSIGHVQLLNRTRPIYIIN